jgi:hypothetical protein
LLFVKIEYICDGNLILLLNKNLKAMKKFNYLLLITVVFLGATIVLSGCKKKEDPAPTETTVSGTAKFPAGVSGDLSNAKVSLYTSITEWQNNIPVKFAAVVGSGASVTFSMTGVLAGTYYLDVWKDVDNSGNWSTGDFVGWYGTGSLGSISLQPFQISSGSTFSCNITMYQLAK